MEEVGYFTLIPTNLPVSPGDLVTNILTKRMFFYTTGDTSFLISHYLFFASSYETPSIGDEIIRGNKVFKYVEKHNLKDKSREVSDRKYNDRKILISSHLSFSGISFMLADVFLFINKYNKLGEKIFFNKISYVAYCTNEDPCEGAKLQNPKLCSISYLIDYKDYKLTHIVPLKDHSCCTLLSGINLFYPSARKWMWTYCIYLGPYIDKNGIKYDLGIFKSENSFSAAIVYGNEEGNYLSGEFRIFSQTNEVYQETLNRALLLNLIPKDYANTGSDKEY